MSRLDPKLVRYATCADESEARWRLERIVKAEVEPVVSSIVSKKLSPAPGSGDWEDVRGEAIGKLIQRLRLVRSDAEQNEIEDLRAFVATTAFRACDEYLRTKYPRRASLQNRLRYVLTHQPGLAVWGDAGRLAGFAAWQGRRAGRSGEYQRLLENPKQIAELQVACPLPELLARVFDFVGHPIELGALVAVAAELLDVRDSETAIEDAGRVPDLRVNLETEVEQRLFLRDLWAEVLQLQPRQRLALLLNLRDVQGRGVIALLPLAGVASIREIAAGLEMDVDQFAALWNDLPLEDAAIAERMEITRQQVINLRKSARERLTRRMRKESST